MRLFHKILIAPLIAMLFTLALGATMVNGLSSSRQALNRLADTRIDHMSLAAETSREMLQVHSGVYRALSRIGGQDGAAVDETRQRLARIERRITKTLTEEDMGEAEGRLGKRMLELIGQYRTAALASLEKAATGRAVDAAELQRTDSLFQQLDEAADELINVEHGLARQENQLADATHERSLALGAVVLVLALLASVSAAWVMAVRIVAPLRRAIAAAGHIADGDLRNPIDTRGSDETAMLCRALDTMQQRLREMVTRISGASTAVARSAQELVGASGTLSGHLRQATQMAQSTARIASNAKDMGEEDRGTP